MYTCACVEHTSTGYLVVHSLDVSYVYIYSHMLYCSACVCIVYIITSVDICIYANWQVVENDSTSGYIPTLIVDVLSRPVLKLGTIELFELLAFHGCREPFSGYVGTEVVAD